jgi:hypothetical protein
MEEVGGMELTETFCITLMETANSLSGVERRRFMARTVASLGSGGQRQAEWQLGWNRGTIRKGLHELHSGITCLDACNGRGRLRAEERLPQLLDDIRDLVQAQSQTDPRFRNQRLYTRLTAEEVDTNYNSRRDIGMPNCLMPAPCVASSMTWGFT